MTRLAKVFNARRLVQGAATVLTVTLALTVRVEHSCSEKSQPYASPALAILYAMGGLREVKTKNPVSFRIRGWLLVAHPSKQARPVAPFVARVIRRAISPEPT
jgi:hypothetical protein